MHRRENLERTLLGLADVFHKGVRDFTTKMYQT